MDPIHAAVLIFCVIITLMSLAYTTLGLLELRDLKRRRLEREARRAAVNTEHEANMLDVSRRVEEAWRKAGHAWRPEATMISTAERRRRSEKAL